MHGKLFIFSAPSGAGKTSIVKALLAKHPWLEFSVSATSRPMRYGEKQGVDYYFMSPEEFRKRIEQNDFLEWEEVYPGSFYGTLRSEVTRIWAKGNHVVFDVDVAGGLKIKNQFGKNALAIFVMPPSIEVLENRLINRKTETEESLSKRLSKARYEIGFSDEFDIIIVNDQLTVAIEEASECVKQFVQKV
ncbi:MAG TPA: guanylate kinase [Bacteroidales bacterium]|nr:guanylate kinase [Bacteroidales bacterium]